MIGRDVPFWDWPVPLFDRSRCDGCGRCVRVCPNRALSMKNGRVVVSDPLTCDYHGFCERVCPVQAIRRPLRIVMVE